MSSSPASKRHDQGSLSGNKESELEASNAPAPARSWLGRKSLLLECRWKWMAFPLGLFLVTRIALLGFAQIVLTLTPDLFVPGGEREVFQHYPALDGLCRWDCEIYSKIARMGYSNAVATNFFPLYPLLARGLHTITGMHPQLALLIVSNVAGLGSLMVIYRIFATLNGEDAARWALTLFGVYPFAFFQAAGYPESLMIFFSALAILLALRGNHFWAGVALGLGVLARHLTMFAGAALVAAQLRQHRPRLQRLVLNPARLGLLVPWLFLGLYCLYLYVQFGNPLAFWAARTQWGHLAWWSIVDLLTPQKSNAHVQVLYASLPFALIPTVGAVALVTRKQWAELAAYALGLLLVVWAVGLLGLGRYAASCWPAFLPLGVWLAKRPSWQGPIVGMLALFQGLFFYLFVRQFPII